MLIANTTITLESVAAVEVLEDISFSIAPGETRILLGPAGDHYDAEE